MHLSLFYIKEGSWVLLFLLSSYYRKTQLIFHFYLKYYAPVRNQNI
jgi:hypothetical protein